jgi:hypothetical protein
VHGSGSTSELRYQAVRPLRDQLAFDVPLETAIVARYGEFSGLQMCNGCRTSS